MSNSSYTNKLVHEKSPYLLSYAHTPINWFPWGEEAFRIAEENNKPIFLSIGHSGSRVCKIMLEENFRDPEIAAIMNDSFVNVKVDKEEYPHLGALYIEFASMLSSDSSSLTGWPLNIFLTSDLIPFFSMNHMILEERFSKGSLKQIMQRVSEIWNDTEEKEEILEQANKVFQVISFVQGCIAKDEFSKDDAAGVVAVTYAEADPVYGGLKSFPKFSLGHQGRFLLNFAKENSESRAAFYIDRTLDMMSRGGIRDHLGGGFYKYTIDDKWMIPCFEKNVMDNAVLALLYLEAWAFTNKDKYLEVGEEILNYLSGNLRNPDLHCYFLSEYGGFIGGKDGGFYTWSKEEIQPALKNRSDLFCDYYGICSEGITNGRNVLHIPIGLDIEILAEKYCQTPAEIESILKEDKKILSEVRNLREKPSIDDQVICYCNGFMIHVLVQAGLITGNSAYFDSAEKTARFIKDHMLQEGGILFRRWREGEAKFNAYLEDYACVILGFLSLFQAGRGIHWLETAVSLVKTVMSRFKCESGIFYSTDGSDPTLILKRREIADRDGISGTAVLADCFLTLYAITGKKDFLHQAEEIFQFTKSFVEMHPFACFTQMESFQRYFARDELSIYICPGNSENRDMILEAFKNKYIPNKSLIWLFPEENQDTSILDNEYVHKMSELSGNGPAIYCSGRDRSIKFSDIKSFIEFIKCK
ncbi:MAG: thioredoxin domain-containing protein [Victivallaceae bacterium]